MQLRVGVECCTSCSTNMWCMSVAYVQCPNVPHSVCTVMSMFVFPVPGCSLTLELCSPDRSTAVSSMLLHAAAVVGRVSRMLQSLQRWDATVSQQLVPASHTSCAVLCPPLSIVYVLVSQSRGSHSSGSVKRALCILAVDTGFIAVATARTWVLVPFFLHGHVLSGFKLGHCHKTVPFLHYIVAS